MKIFISFYFLCLISLVRASSTTLNSSGKSGHHCLVPHLRGKAFGLSLTSMRFSSVLSLSYVWLFETPWTAARQTSLSINSWGLLKLMSTELVMPSNHLILCCPLLLPPSTFPSIRIFSSESVLCIRWLKYWSFSSASVLPMNIQGWFPLGLTGLISLLSKGLSRVVSSTINWKQPFFSAQLSL